MINEISKKQIILLLKNGLEVWLDEDRATEIQKTLVNSKENFFSIKDFLLTQSIFTIEGFYTPSQLAEIKHSKNGDWQCEYFRGTEKWHSKGEKIEDGHLFCKKERQKIDDKLNGVRRIQIFNEDTGKLEEKVVKNSF